MAFDQMARALASVLLASTARIAAAVRAKEDDGRSAPVTVGNARKGETAAEITVSGAFATGIVADAREAHMMGTADAQTPVVMRRIRTVGTHEAGQWTDGTDGIRPDRRPGHPHDGGTGDPGDPGDGGYPGSDRILHRARKSGGGQPSGNGRRSGAAGESRRQRSHPPDTAGCCHHRP